MIFCGKKKGFFARLGSFKTCQNCRDLYNIGYTIEQIRELEYKNDSNN